MKNKNIKKINSRYQYLSYRFPKSWSQTTINKKTGNRKPLRKKIQENFLGVQNMSLHIKEISQVPRVMVESETKARKILQNFQNSEKRIDLASFQREKNQAYAKNEESDQNNKTGREETF